MISSTERVSEANSSAQGMLVGICEAALVRFRKQFLAPVCRAAAKELIRQRTPFSVRAGPMLSISIYVRAFSLASMGTGIVPEAPQIEQFRAAVAASSYEKWVVEF